MSRFIAVAIVSSLFICSSVFAGGLTDEDVHARPESPPTFAYDHKVSEPTFGTTLMRVTGPSGSNAVYESSAETQNLAPLQHFHNPWNCDTSLFVIWADRLSGGGGTRIDLYSFNSINFEATRVRSLGIASKFNINRGIKFSTNTSLAEADRKYLLYATNTAATPNRIDRWNLDLSAPHDGLAAGGNETIYTDSEGIEQLTVSRDCDRFSWYTTNSKVKVYVKSTDTLYTKDCSAWYSFDETQLSDDGKYVFVKGHENNGETTTLMLDYTLTDEWDYDAYAPDYFAGKHSGYGNKWVNECAQFSTYRLPTRTLDDDRPGDAPNYAFISPVSPVGAVGSIHPSYSISGYIFGGFFKTTGYDATKPYIDEIVRFEDQNATQNGNRVLRLAHAWSNFYSNSYDEIPSYADPSGNYVMFYSNWDGADSNARHDVFIIQISPSASVSYKGLMDAGFFSGTMR